MDDRIKILELLSSKKNVLLMGAPGTGKSRVMNEVAETFINGGTRLAQPSHVPGAGIPIPAVAAPTGLDLAMLKKANRKVFRTTLHQNSKYRDFLTGIVPELGAGGGYRINEGTTASQVKNILSTAVSEFGHQGLPSKQRLSIPARNKEWQPAYDLSFDIVKGLGSSYDAERFVAPGFVVDTWQLWEWLVTTGMRIGNTKHTILPQNSVRWGYKEAYSGKYSVNVFPDIEVVTKDSQLTPLYLLDAKYKLVKNATTGEVERDDLYEAFAFCSATDTNEIVLVYPADDPANIPGHVKKCSTYRQRNP